MLRIGLSMTVEPVHVALTHRWDQTIPSAQHLANDRPSFTTGAFQTNPTALVIYRNTIW